MGGAGGSLGFQRKQQREQDYFDQGRHIVYGFCWENLCQNWNKHIYVWCVIELLVTFDWEDKWCEVKRLAILTLLIPTSIV